MKMNFIKTIEEKGIEVLSLIVAIIIWQFIADRDRTEQISSAEFL